MQYRFYLSEYRDGVGLSPNGGGGSRRDPLPR